MNAKRLKAQARNYKALTWAEEDILEDGNGLPALPSKDLEEDGVYLVRCLDTGTLQALELYNDSKEGVDICRTETAEFPYVKTPAQGSKPAKAMTGKQTKHTNSQRLVEEAAKGKPELPFKEIVPKEYWNYRKVFEGRPKGQLLLS